MLRCKNNIRILVITLSFIIYHLSFNYSFAQVGTWRNYLAYSEVQQICAAGDDIFVRASNGLYQYNQKDQSIYTYDKTNGLSDTNIRLIAWNRQAKRLIAVYQNSNIDLIDTNNNITNISSLYTKTTTEDKTVNSIRIDGIYAYLICSFGIVKVNMQRAEITDTYTPNHPEYPTSLPEEDNSDYDKYIDLIKTLKPDGPKYNHFGFMKFDNGRLYTCGGGNNNTNIPATVQILKDKEWEIYEDYGVEEKTGVPFINFNCLDYDPNDINHVFVGSRTGLYEYNNGKFIKFFNDSNSPIESFNNSAKDYELIYGVKFDKNSNLWILNSQAPTQSLIEYNKEGKFISHSIPELMGLNDGGYTGKSLGQLSNMIIDSQGYLWFVNNHWINASLYRYDIDNNKIITYSNFVNQDGAAITSMYAVTCVTEDKEGNMWIGTDVGLFLLEKSQIEASNPYYTQVKVPRNDGTNYADYLLNNVSITSICIDSGNRKWIATNGDGVYLISADNMTQIHHFKEDNSKLLSNIINSIAINNISGEVFFGTENGICSYMSDATQTNSEMTNDNIWAYPNPVTSDYHGLITIVGLSYNADVKIVSSTGTLVAEGRSNGGTFTWDGNDKKGNHVASGVYMVITATSEGNKGAVCKIAIVN